MGDDCNINSSSRLKEDMIDYYKAYDFSCPAFDSYKTPSKIYTWRPVSLVQNAKLLVPLNTVKVPEWPASPCLVPMMNEGHVPG